MIQCELKDIQKHYAENDFDVLKVPLNIDFAKLKRDCFEIIQTVSLKEKDTHGQRYKGIGLQYEDESNPLYDAIDQFTFIPGEGEPTHYRKSKFITKKNEYGEKLDYLFAALQPLNAFRGRILNAAPGIKMQPHTDGKYVLNIHIPLQSNPDCLMHVNGKPYFFEPDGSLYVLNARRLHHITNTSDADRIHVIFTLNFFSFRQWPKETIDSIIAEMNIPEQRERIYKYYGLTP